MTDGSEGGGDMAWVGAAVSAYSAYENAQAKKKAAGGSSGMPGLSSDAWSNMGFFDTSGWQVTTGGGQISGSTATGGRQSATTEQRPIATMSPGIDSGFVPAGGLDQTTLMILGAGALLVLVVAMRKRK